MKLSTQVRRALNRQPCKSRPNSVQCTASLKRALQRAPAYRSIPKIDQSHKINIRIHDLLGEREKLAKLKRKPKRRRRMRSRGEIAATALGYGLDPRLRLAPIGGFRPDLAGGAAAVGGAILPVLGGGGAGGLGGVAAVPPGGLGAAAAAAAAAGGRPPLVAPPLPAAAAAPPHGRGLAGAAYRAAAPERVRSPRKKSAAARAAMASAASFVEPGADSPPMFGAVTRAEPPPWGSGETGYTGGFGRGVRSTAARAAELVVPEPIRGTQRLAEAAVEMRRQTATGFDVGSGLGSSATLHRDPHFLHSDAAGQPLGTRGRRAETASGDVSAGALGVATLGEQEDESKGQRSELPSGAREPRKRRSKVAAAAEDATAAVVSEAPEAVMAVAAQPKSRRHRSQKAILEEKQSAQNRLIGSMEELNARPRQTAAVRASYARKQTQLGILQAEIRTREAVQGMVEGGGRGAGRPSLADRAAQAKAGEMVSEKIPMALPHAPRSALADAARRAEGAAEDPAFPEGAAAAEEPSLAHQKALAQLQTGEGVRLKISAESPQPAMKFGRPASRHEDIGGGAALVAAATKGESPAIDWHERARRAAEQRYAGMPSDSSSLSD